MTLVARVTFLVLVGATFSAFFVAQRLKSDAAGHQRRPTRHASSRPTATATATSTASRSRCEVADDATVDVVNLDGDRVKRLADSVAVRAYRPLRLVWDGTSDDGARASRTASTGCASRCATRAARRRPEDDQRRHQGAALGGLHRLPVHRPKKRRATSSPRATAR